MQEVRRAVERVLPGSVRPSELSSDSSADKIDHLFTQVALSARIHFNKADGVISLCVFYIFYCATQFLQENHLDWTTERAAAPP